jgi:adenine/guanine phosphoribosyltransferase-like PRPP-binding protein
MVFTGEVGIKVANEMMKYEGAMDWLRGMAKTITEDNGGDQGFELIYRHCRKFAEDILGNNKVLDGSVDALKVEVAGVLNQAGMGEEWVKDAAKEQLCRRGGFWEMRRYLGQFDVAAAEIYEAEVDQIVCAGISGGVIGEFLGLKLERNHGLKVPVDHMVFSRQEKGLPSRGWLPREFKYWGKRILIVEDMVVELRTVETMLRTLDKSGKNLEFCMFALEIDQNQAVAEKIGQLMAKVISFDE